MWIVVCQLKIFILEVENAFYLRVQRHVRQRTGITGQLQLNLLQMVVVDVCVAQGMYEIARFQAGHLRHHLEQQGVGSNVERYAEEDVGTTLIELLT